MIFQYQGSYHPTPFIRIIQLILLVLIIIGIGLLCTERIWVPKLVHRILINDPNVLLVDEILVKNIY